MTAASPLHERMARAARELESQTGTGHTYRSAVELAVDNVTGCQAAGLSIAYRDRRVETLAASADWAADADRLQYALGEGPCVDATWEQHLVHSRRLVDDERWPTWGPRVTQETGAQSILSLQLFTHANSLGAINLYSRRADAFDAEDRIDGIATAAHIAIAVAGSQAVEHLESAVASRTVIGNAVGITMERYGITGQRAFAVLARIASEREAKVRTVASEVVADHRERHGLTPTAD